FSRDWSSDVCSSDLPARHATLALGNTPQGSAGVVIIVSRTDLGTEGGYKVHFIAQTEGGRHVGKGEASPHHIVYFIKQPDRVFRILRPGVVPHPGVGPVGIFYGKERKHFGHFPKRG